VLKEYNIYTLFLQDILQIMIALQTNLILYTFLQRVRYVNRTNLDGAYCLLRQNRQNANRFTQLDC